MLVDPDHPFFKRLWVRILCVVFPLVWAGVELSNDSPGWAALFGASGLYLLYSLFLSRRGRK